MGVFLAVLVLAPAIAVEAGIPAAPAGIDSALVDGGALVLGGAGAFSHWCGGIRVPRARPTRPRLPVTSAAIGRNGVFLAEAGPPRAAWVGRRGQGAWMRMGVPAFPAPGTGYAPGSGLGAVSALMGAGLPHGGRAVAKA